MIIYQSQIDAAKVLTSPLDGGQYKLLVVNGERIVISLEHCTNKNHSHDMAGPCNLSSWIPRHDCYYCGDYNSANDCGHYAPHKDDAKSSHLYV